MVDIQTVSVVIASAGVFAAAIYYIFQLGHQTKIRKTDLIIRLSSTIDNKDFAEAIMKIVSTDFKDVEELRNIVSPQALIMVANFYERVGALLNRGLVDAGLVDDILIVEPMWEKMKHWVIYCRQKYNMPTLFVHFEYLYNEMKENDSN